MLKSMVCLLLAFPFEGLLAQQQFEGFRDQSAEATEVSDAEYNSLLATIGEARLAQEEAEDLEAEVALFYKNADEGKITATEIQWSGRRWRCVARARRSGRAFVGVSQNINQARRNAMQRCRWNSSSSCFSAGCR